MRSRRLHRFKRGSGFPVRVPCVEIEEIGTGGGSIAWIDQFRHLQVGPRSASSVPGPACYGRGGTHPTVTDADLVLGYLDPEYFLGGEMRLDIEASRRAIHDGIAKPLGITLAQAAWGIHRVANEDMANAFRIHAMEHGRDSSRYALLCFGGAVPFMRMGSLAFCAHRQSSRRRRLASPHLWDFWWRRWRPKSPVPSSRDLTGSTGIILLASWKRWSNPVEISWPKPDWMMLSIR